MAGLINTPTREVGTVMLRGTVDNTIGFTEDHSMSEKADKTEHKNGDGEVVGITYINCRLECSCTIELKKEAEIDVGNLIGTKYTFKSITGKLCDAIIDDMQLSEKKGDTVRYSINATHYPKLT